MTRFLFVSLCVFVALAWVMILSNAHAQSPPAPTQKQPATIEGRWSGQYVCAQGITDLTLTVKNTANGQIAATFNFGPSPENPGVPEGAYSMAGRYDPQDGHMVLTSKEWIDAPSGYVMVDLEGFTRGSGLYISGSVRGPGCGPFAIMREPNLIS